MTVIVRLMGGLGNWLFQIAFAEYLSKHGVPIKLEVVSKSPHSSEEYMNTILAPWKLDMLPDRMNFILGRQHFMEERLQIYNWIPIVESLPNLTITGYFQNFTYITQSFIEKLNLPTNALNRHPTIKNTVFIHIRGSDYVNHSVHDVNLDNYYSHAIKLFSEGTIFSVFTNDIQYAQSKSFLKEVSHVFITEPEVDSLYLMSQCSGGICANSSFSWWGAYLNRTRKLILPSKWYNDMSLYTGGYYFNEATILDV